MPQAVAIAANRHDVAVMDEPIDPRGGHCSADTQMNPNLARGWAPAVSERSRSLSDFADGLRTEKIRFWREWSRFRELTVENREYLVIFGPDLLHLQGRAYDSLHRRHDSSV